ncbi:MAG: caspase family protein [Sphingobacteriales bacterium]|nr:caspase family protein [Sphingobacteriales bacterium]
MSHLSRMLLFAGFFMTTCSAGAQTLYEINYHYIIDGVKDNYQAFMLRNNDGTGFIRLEFYDSTGKIRNLLEMPMEEIYGEHEDGSEDTTQLIFFALEPKVILGSTEDYLPDHFVFHLNPDSDFYEPSFVYCVNEDSTQETGELDKVRLLNQEDLTKELVLQYFTEEDNFYKQQFETVTRGLSTEEKQTRLHLVLVANTEDKDIGKTCVIDKDATYKTFSEISEFLGIQFNPLVIAGKDFSKVNVDKAVSSLHPGPNDIVVFYYSGHGFNEVNEGYQFPYLDLRDKSFQKYGGAFTLNIESIYQKLKAKGARLNLVLSDCCNRDPTSGALISSEGASTRTSSIGWSQENCQALFLSQKPMSLLMTAAQKGELSAGNAADGGIFTFNFRESLEKSLGPFTKNPAWNTLVASAKAQTINKARHTWCDKERKQVCVQNPVFKME